MILTQMLCLTLMFFLQSANDQSMLILVQSVLGIQAIEDQTIRGILALAPKGRDVERLPQKWLSPLLR